MIVLKRNTNEKVPLRFHGAAGSRFICLKEYPNVEILTKAALLRQFSVDELNDDSRCIIGVRRKLYEFEKSALVFEQRLYGDYCIVTDSDGYMYLSLWLNSPWGFGELLDYDFDKTGGVVSKQSLGNVILPFLDINKRESASDLYALDLVGAMAETTRKMIAVNSGRHDSLLASAENFFRLIGNYALMEIVIPDDFQVAGVEILRPWREVLKKFTQDDPGKMVIDIISHVLTSDNVLRANVNKMKFFSTQFRIKVIDLVNDAHYRMSQ